jgi:RNA polymerase sigma-70 factor, ECF subfamily
MMQPISTIPIPEQQEITGLVKQALNGDLDAYGKLYAVYLDRIYRYIYYQIRDEMKAQDLTQEVFIKAWKAIKSCGGKEQTFTPWLYRIAHNHTVDNLRKSHHSLPLEMAEIHADGDVEQDAVLAMEWQQVLKEVSDLPDQQRQIILLKYMEGYDNSEIEKITGKRQGAIRAIQMRALMSLRQRLKVEVSSHGD